VVEAIRRGEIILSGQVDSIRGALLDIAVAQERLIHAVIDELRAPESDADVPAGSWARDDPAPSIRSVA